MEFVRRPSVLAAVAAALLVLNIVVLQDDGSSPDEPVIDGALGDSADEDEAEGTTTGDDTDAEDTDGDAAEGADDAADDASGDEAADGDATDEGDDPAEGARGAIVAPSAGTYTYASSGSWSLTGGPEATDEQLPGTATATVTGAGEDWAMELVAGPKYADRFAFTIGSAGGLDWDGWELDRDFGNGIETTPYTCSGDAAYYVNDAAAGRTSQHGCATAIAASSGMIEYVGTEDVTLGDGTVVTADRLLYTYTVTGTGVSGDGRLDLWLDPATGMRVREQRTIDTVTNANGVDYVYAEDVEFVLQSLTAS